MSEDRARLTIGRDYCRGCKRPSVQRFAGWATEDARENSCRPRAFYRTCEVCGTPRLVLQNVSDAEGLCRSVLKKWLDAHGGTGAAVGATERPFGDGSLDADDGLSFLTGEVWRIYLVWQPARSDNSFLAYASDLLPRRLATWSRNASGEVENRPGGRVFPKAHAASVSVSLDGLANSGDDGDGGGGERAELVGVHAGSGTFSPDHAEDRALDLLRSLAAGGGGEAGHQQGARHAAPKRVPQAG